MYDGSFGLLFSQGESAAVRKEFHRRKAYYATFGEAVFDQGLGPFGYETGLQEAFKNPRTLVKRTLET